MMIDDALTEKQELTSKIVGRAQGLYSVAAQRDHEFALLVVVTFAFVEGKYKGSTISILGWNPVLNDVRDADHWRNGPILVCPWLCLSPYS